MTWNVCSDPSPGYDLAHWQGKIIPWEASRALGIEWAIAKTWHGRGEVTSQLTQLEGARLAGIGTIGRYAWLLPDEDLDLQIGAWCGPHYPRVVGELPLTIDWEHPDTKLRGRELLKRGEYVVEKVSDRLGCRPILYTGNWYMVGFCGDLDSQIFAECPLWLAAYPRKSATGTRYQEAIAEVCGGVMPAVPRPWRERGIEPTLWQFDGDKGLYLPNGVDVDVNIAARAKLQALRLPAVELAEPGPTRRDTPSAIAAARPSTPPPVHLPPRGETLRANPWGHAYALTESPPSIDPIEVVRWLAVERSPRYRPSSAATYCNVYAYDLCNALGAFLPRVYWLEPVIAAFMRGETREPVLGTTVRELSANDLFRWFERWGTTYGWERVSNLNDAQDAANGGAPVVICARQSNEHASGHIGCVLPESDACRALRGESGAVLLPVQSMAGGATALLELGQGRAWWRGVEFADFGFWVNAGMAALAVSRPAEAPGNYVGVEVPRRAGPPIERVEAEHTVPTEDPEL